MVFLQCRNLNQALVDCLDWWNNQIIKTGSLRLFWVSNPFYLLTETHGQLALNGLLYIHEYEHEYSVFTDLLKNFKIIFTSLESILPVGMGLDPDQAL